MRLRHVVPWLEERSYRLRYRRAAPPLRHWLVMTETKYGGKVTGLPRRKASELDPRSPEELAATRLVGGDRMSSLHHGYAGDYARHLADLVNRPGRATVVEVGILAGTGLALWADLFPDGRIIGLDIDITHAADRLPALRAAGAFAHGDPELYEFDQFRDNREILAEILAGDRVDLFIDDGAHSHEAILTTFESAVPWLADEFLYFIEDNRTVSGELRARYPGLHVESCGDLTVVRPSGG